MDTFHISWSAPEYTHWPKGLGWYWTSIMVAVAILAVSVWQRNFLFAAFIVLAEILVLTWAERPPKTLNFTLTEKGLTIDEKTFYPLGNFKSFSLNQDEEEYPDWSDFVFLFESHLRPSLKIQAPTGEAHAISEALRKKMPEVKQEPSLLDALERFFRF